MINTTSISNLQNFSYEDKKIRTVCIDGEPWWILRDVCNVLGLSDPTMTATRLDLDERAKFNLGRQGEVNIINESGLYSVIIRSDKPEAKKFRKWITSEILPQIRRTGKYSVPTSAAPVESNPAIKDELLSERDAAHLLAITEGTLKSWRYKGKGPKVTMVGNLVRYSSSSIQEFIRMSNSGSSSRTARLEPGEVRPSYNIADLAAAVIDRFSKSMTDLANQNAQDGHSVLGQIFNHKIIADDGWVNVGEMIMLLTSDHIARGADPAKIMTCEKKLKELGLRLELNSDKDWILWISNTHNGVARILAATTWAKHWGAALKMIPGALRKDLMRFTGSPTAATGIPLKETALLAKDRYPLKLSDLKPYNPDAPDCMNFVNNMCKLTGNMRITNVQLVYIVLHAVSNAHLLRG